MPIPDPPKPGFWLEVEEAEEEKTLPPAFASELRPNLFDELWPNPIEPEVTDALL